MAEPTPTSTLDNPSHSTLHNRDIDVKMFGAVGDGLTDDTAAFQDAIDASEGLRPVYVPTPDTYYRITDTLTVSSNYGLEMYGNMNLGSGKEIKIINFPANSDVFEMTATGANFPQLRLSGLFFNGDNTPRDFYRQSYPDNHGIRWQNLYIQGISGYGLHCPVGKELVHPELRNVHMLSCASGGVYVAGAGGLTAALFDHCRWASNVTDGGADIYVNDADGLTIIAPTFDGTNAGSNDFDRLSLESATGVVIIDPYVEWAAATMTGTLSNIRLDSCADVTVIGGVGSVAPLGAASTFVPIRVIDSDGTLMLNPPIQRWKGSATVGLEYSGTVTGTHMAFVNTSTTAIAVGTVHAPTTTIYNQGLLMRQELRACPNLTGATPDMQGAVVGHFVNASPTNVTNLLGGQTNHTIVIRAHDNNTTLVHAGGGTGSFRLQGGANYTMTADRTIMLTYFSGVWCETGR